MNIESYVEDFTQIYSDLLNMNSQVFDNLETEEAIKVALGISETILKERAKDNRQNKIQNNYDGNKDKESKGKGERDWESEPATDKQLDFLDTLGVNYEEPLSKSEASDLIEANTGD